MTRPSSSPTLPKTMAEFIGTFAMVFFGCGAIRLGLPPEMASLSFGLTVAVMVYFLGHLSGAHFNPAVTLGFALTKHFPFRLVGAYWISQIAGASLAILLLSLLTPGMTGFGAVTPRVGPWQIFGWETVLTFFLMLVIIAVATDPRVPKTMAGAAIGGMVAIGSVVGGPITGATMNPARYLAPAIFEGKWEWWWIYLAAAFSGAALAAFIPIVLASKNNKPPTS